MAKVPQANADIGKVRNKSGNTHKEKERRDEMRKLYTAEELAKLLSVTKHTIYVWGLNGTIESLKIGSVVRYYHPGDKEKN